ncbi:hypothetical protein SAMN04487895_10138 [Paenibacillus sophorae]|uniref:DUF116 domain-containing protein n=1 Tax=Paenibacillus sophorae TaxID=1333845 RepID=A0A1H8F983_9BACL|nr:DUF116 domain-containing protein [Paenibacillus sophorae]QWU13807.1 DUF116 domain-containing protein [Paenibacillus sophorae]SEN28383.1 hypothetical protein SAMN04487895_10138 [Paenibacillus sophorae]
MSETVTETLTYSLCGDRGETDKYYADVAAFTDEVMESLREEEQTIQEFKHYIADNNLKPIDSAVYALEFLMIGVLWRIYGRRAGAGSIYMGKLLSSLYSIRNRSAGVKIAVNRLKGIAGTTVLARSRKLEGAIDLKRFGRLIGWLRASGEFEQESKRLAVWLDFLNSKPPSKSENMLLRAERLGFWFEQRSKVRLGCYTSGVDAYIENNRQRLKWKENRIFCSRERVEYHLNMVGAEIMNRAFHGGFSAAKEKRVFLPVCMRHKSSEACKAVKEGEGYRCRSCSKECQVNAVTAMAKEYGCKVVMIPHASTAFGHQRIREGEVGIVGIACVLNLISGGYKAKEMGYEPQCVLLHYSGCIQHWHPKGIETRIDVHRLEEILKTGQKTYT